MVRDHSLHTVYCAMQCTQDCTLSSMHTMHFTVHTMHFTVQCAHYGVHCTSFITLTAHAHHSPHTNYHSQQCNGHICIALCTLYTSVQCTLPHVCPVVRRMWRLGFFLWRTNLPHKDKQRSLRYIFTSSWSFIILEVFNPVWENIIFNSKNVVKISLSPFLCFVLHGFDV